MKNENEGFFRMKVFIHEFSHCGILKNQALFYMNVALMKLISGISTIIFTMKDGEGWAVDLRRSINGI